MFFIPIGIWNGSPKISVGYYIWKSLIPSVIGNIIGGGFFVGTAYWYLYLTGEGSVAIDFNLGSLESAMEAGGPMGGKRQRQSPSEQTAVSGHNAQNGSFINGIEPPELPHSGGNLSSGIGRELSADVYAKRKGEPSEKGSHV